MFPERCSRGVFEAKRRAARGSFRRSYSRTYRSDTGEHKNDVRGGGGRGRRACSTSYLTRRVTRSVYNDRGTRTHVRIQRRARTRARRILDPSSLARARASSSAPYTCKNHQRNTCVRRNVGDYDDGPISRRPVGRLLGSASAKPFLQNYDAYKSARARARGLLLSASSAKTRLRPISPSARLGITSDR